MNFSPNTDYYNDINKEIENAISSVNDTFKVKFNIRSEEDVSSQLEDIEKDVSNHLEIAEKRVENISNSLKSLIESDFKNALEGYQKAANLFCDNSLYDLFSDNCETFPFNEWANVNDLKIKFNDVREFFRLLPKSNSEELNIFFSNMTDAISSTPYSEKPYFFYEAVKSIQNFSSKEKTSFLTKTLAKDLIFKNSLFTFLLKEDLLHNNEYELFYMDIKKVIVEQCAEEKPKQLLINFFLNSDVFCTKQNNRMQNNPITGIKVEIFKKLIDLDVELNLNLKSLMVSQLIETVSKQKNNENLITRCQEISSYLLSEKLQKELSIKNNNSTKIKI